MTIFSGSVESTRHPGTTRHFNYMKFLKEKDLKSLFYLFISRSPIKYDIVTELKSGSLPMYVAANTSALGVDLISVYQDKDNENLGILTTIGVLDEGAEITLKEFLKITRVKEQDVPLEELEKTVMENIDFYNKF